MKTPFLFFTFVLVLTTPNCRAQTEEDQAAIRNAIKTMTTAFNTRDDAATASIATADADFVAVTGRWSKGIDAYLKARRERFTTALRDASLQTTDVTIRFVRPDVALVHVTHEITGMLDSNGQPLPPHQELSLRVFIKQNGKWLMTAFHNTTVAVLTPKR